MGLFLLKINTWLIRLQSESRYQQEKEFVSTAIENAGYHDLMGSLNDFSRRSKLDLPAFLDLKVYKKIMGHDPESILDYYSYLLHFYPQLNMKPLPSTALIPDPLDTIVLNDFVSDQITNLIETNKVWDKLSKPDEIVFILNKVEYNGNEMTVDISKMEIINDIVLEAEVNGRYIPATNPMVLKENEVLTKWRMTNPITNETQIFKHQ